MTKLAIDANAKGMQVLRPESTQKLAISSTAASATAWGTNIRVLRLVSTVGCYYSLDGTATTSDVYLPAESLEFIHVMPGDSLSVITDNAGSIFITEMI